MLNRLSNQALITLMFLLLASVMAFSELALAAQKDQFHTPYQLQRIALPLSMEIADVEPLKERTKHVEEKPAYSKKDLKWLTIALYHEDRYSTSSDVEIAQLGYAILNRADHRRLGGESVKSIVSKPGQFPWYNKNVEFKLVDAKAKKRAAKIARMVLEGTIENLIGGADHFLATNTNRSWTKSMDGIGRIGKHKYFDSRGV